MACTVAFAQRTREEARQAAITEFTQKQQAANWPEKFARIGNEMGVPSPMCLRQSLLPETRWEHLTWPPGETASPENGQPRGYGIMFLQDNQYFGHSLVEAAQLIGKTPDELKNDPELNPRRSGVVEKDLRRKSKPDFASPEADRESWYNAVIKYTSIPEPFLSHQHALNCYVFMSKGYNQYGMHWQPHPVDLTPMRADVAKLRKEFDEAIRQKQATNVVRDEVQPPASDIVTKPVRTNEVAPKPVVAAAECAGSTGAS